MLLQLGRYPVQVFIHLGVLFTAKPGLEMDLEKHLQKKVGNGVGGPSVWDSKRQTIFPTPLIHI